ncbi:MAG: C25 family cysteine peptidase [Ignavibacteria bacterium]|jgi:hypothetical protein
MNNKLLVILAFFLLLNIVYPQIISQNVIYEGKKLEALVLFPKENYTIDSTGLKEVNFLNYSGVNEAGSPVLPYKYLFVAIPPGSQIISISFQEKESSIIDGVVPSANPLIVAASDSTTKTVKQKISSKYSTFKMYPAKEFEILQYIWLRGIYTAVIKCNTHRYNFDNRQIIITKQAKLNLAVSKAWSKDYKKTLPSYVNEIKDCYINLENISDAYDPNHQYTKLLNGSDWIDYDVEYVKLGIGQDGIFRINYDELELYGLSPSAIDPKKIKIFGKGKELPLFVYGEEDGVFDSQDYIEFYAQKNYEEDDYKTIVAEGEDYINYLSRYTDTTFVFLVWEGDDGKRVENISTFESALLDTINYYSCKLHLEEDERIWYYGAEDPRTNLPYWQEHKIWTWLVMGASGNKQIKFNADSPIPNSDVEVSVRVISNAADVITNAHRLGLSLNNNTVSDTSNFNYYETVNFSASYPADQLIEGENVVRVFGLTSSASFHQSLIDWVDVSYLRKNNAINDSLYFELPINIIESGKKIITIQNITANENDIILYRVLPDTQKVTAYELKDGTLYFSDNIETNTAYTLTTTSNALKPVFCYEKKFKNLSSSKHSASYILITGSKLLVAASEYLNWVIENYDVKGKLVLTEDIYDEFSFGEIAPEAIKDFLITAYNNWSGDKPEYLFLVGEANYDFKDKLTSAPEPPKENIVPSYGMPVSDTWYTVWDESEISQMKVGRLTAESTDEVYRYLQKMQLYALRDYDYWNKQFLFFSGGDTDNESELKSLYNTNQYILEQYIEIPPIGGKGNHFYKTSTSNFGDYDDSYISNAIQEGGLFISYLGHSGTQTWDNGITTVADLQNFYTDRFSLITDFGCSTGKFAEPDVDSFSEEFVQRDEDGIGINYCGNSSLGFLSTSLQYPKLFYNRLISDSSTTVGAAHLNAKIELFEKFGLTNVAKVFNYCNTLFGDPIIKIKLPPLPNFSINSNDVSILNESLDEKTDSIYAKVIIYNYGLVGDSLVQLSVTDVYNNNKVYESKFELEPILYSDTVTVAIPVDERTGLHKIVIYVDYNDKIVEIDENDNEIEYQLNIYSSSTRALQKNDYYTEKSSLLKLLNPQLDTYNSDENLTIEIADNEYFDSPVTKQITVDTMITNIALTQALGIGKRYWWRTKFSGMGEWSNTYSFIYGIRNWDWSVGNSFQDSDLNTTNLTYDSVSASWKLEESTNELVVRSAGWLDGAFASILLNSDEYLSNTYFWGIAMARIDTLNLEPYDVRFFIGPPSQTAADSLIAYLNSLSEGDMIAITTSTDAAQSVIGYTPPSDARDAIKNFGSILIDSVGYRESWCMIGTKGATPGTAIEDYKEVYDGVAEVSLSKEVVNKEGTILFPSLRNSAKWDSLHISFDKPTGSQIELTAIGQTEDNDFDTLATIDVNESVIDLSFINASKYPDIKLLATLYANDIFESPDISKLTASYKGMPELATNYQVVSIYQDTVDIGENIELNFDVYNVGESSADSFYVEVDLVNENNTSQTNIFKELVTSIDSMQNKSFQLSYNTVDLSGNYKFNINIDTEDKITELYEDNNFYSIPFYVIGDTTTPTFNVTFDGEDIFDGQYITSTPNIRVELTDPSLVPITDTSSVSLYLNGNKISYSGNQDVINYNFSDSNPKVTVDYNPTLEDGEYELTVFAKDASGNIAVENGYSKNFIVTNETKILNVYNYPNPFNNDTYFTFMLTQIPEEIKIKIYTVAGRLIKEIELTSGQLNFDFNKIYWDGRDEDGHLAGNGVYFYKVIMKDGEKTEDITQKLAIVR